MKRRGILFPTLVSALLGGMIMTSCGNQDGPAEKEVIISSISVSNQKTSYSVGDSFIKPTVTVLYSDGSSKDVSDSAQFFGFNSETSGDKTITVSYNEGGKTVSTSYKISVAARILVLTDIKIDTSTKFVYEYGEEFVRPVIVAYYNDDTSTRTDVSSKVKVTFDSENQFNPKLSGDYMIFVEYTELGVTKQISYKTRVNPPANLIQKIEFSGTIQDEYSVGDTLAKPTVIATFSNESTQDVTDECVFTYNFDEVGPATVTASYTQDRITVSESYDVTVVGVESKIKFAIFADVQLCNSETIAGKAVANLGDTTNAPLALEQHLKYIKSQDIDVVLMDGDITNQANEYYYNYFNNIVEKVYGSDKSAWPEFVSTMGNHEWWEGTTETDPREGSVGNYTLPDDHVNAVKLFNDNARIESDNLVKRSAVTYATNVTDTVPSYYKVINGVPFLVVSGVNANGILTDALENEIKGWISEIQQLPSVIAGGPVFVEYHYPLSTTFTHGQGSMESTAKFEALFKDVPNAIVFTGDTHFPGNNERSINQVDFTAINLGTSSYSRMVDESAVICSNYENVTGGLKSTKGDRAQGNVGYDNAYTPNIEIVEVLTNNTTKINRFMTNDDGSARKVGETWTLPATTSKDNFKYTDARFQKKESAQALYGKDGVSWENTDTVEFGVDKEAHQMTVHFKDPIEHHFVEHYQIKVNEVVHDFVSDYYKYPEKREQNYYIIENLPDANTYTVEVIAYDFFDNPSLNKLTASETALDKSVDPVDYFFADQNYNYSDIESRNNFQITSTKSNSSSEFHYKGIQTHDAGAILGRIYDKEGYNINDYITLEPGEGSKPTVTVDVKNLEADDLVFGLSVIEDNGGKEKWDNDFGLETQQTVTGDDWTTLTWNLYDLFGINSKEKIQRIILKAKSKGATSAGYNMDFLVDNIDIYNSGDTPTPPTPPTPEFRGEEFVENNDYSKTFDGVTDKVTIDVKFTSSDSTKISFMLGDGWKDYYGYFDLYPTSKTGDIAGLTVSSTTDGYTRFEIEISKLPTSKIVHDTDGKGTIDEINLIYFRGIWSTASGYVDINPSDSETVRGSKFSANTDAAFNIDPVSMDKKIVLDVKFETGSDTHFNVMLGDGWKDYYGYYELTANSKATDYQGLTVSATSDGYVRYTFDLSNLSAGKAVHDAGGKGTFDEINLIYIRGAWTTASGLIDINPKEGSADVVRGKVFEFTKEDSNKYEEKLSKYYSTATDSIIIDIKFDNKEDTKINIMFCDFTDWDYYFGYYELSKKTTSTSYTGVTVELLTDGYMEFTFKLSELTIFGNNNPAPTSINHIYTRGIWCNGGAYIDLITK